MTVFVCMRGSSPTLLLVLLQLFYCILSNYSTYVLVLLRLLLSTHTHTRACLLNLMFRSSHSSYPLIAVLQFTSFLFTNPCVCYYFFFISPLYVYVGWCMSVASFRFLLLKLSIVLGTIARPSGRGVPSCDTQTLLCVCSSLL